MAAAPTQFRGLPPAPAHNPALCIIPAEADTPQGILCRIVVDLEPAVVGVGEQLRFELHGIAQRFRQR